MFSLIAAVGKNRELGKRGGLVFRIKDDMKFFKETTMGHTVVMGRKTWESLPGKLPGRKNLVVSREEVPGADGTITSLSEFIVKNENSSEEIFIIGGGMVYTEFLKHAKKLYLTEVDATADDADTFFPEFDRNKYERRVIKEGKENDLTFVISEYILK